MSSITLPSNKELEISVLCSCISSIDVFNKAVDILQPDDFFCDNHGQIFKEMLTFYEQNIPLRSHALLSKVAPFITEGEKRAILDFYRFDLYEVSIPSVYELKDMSKRRKTIFSAQELMKSASQEEDSEKILDQHMRNLNAVFSSGSAEFCSFSNVNQNFRDNENYKKYLKKIYDRVQSGESPYQGVCSGYHKLDYALGSFQSGSLTYIGGLTSTGKTAFMLNLIYNMATAGKKVAICSLEMHRNIIFQNFIAMKVCVPVQKIQRMTLTPEELMRIESLDEADPIFSNILIDGFTDIQVIASRIRRMVRNEGVEAVFIDYLTCITATGRYSNNSDKVNMISKTLQSLGKELNVPIICLAQFNRQADSDPSKAPKISHFKESGSIEQDADTCIILHRPRRVDQKSPDQTLHVMIQKNRLMGELSTIHYLWDESRWGFYQELENPQEFIQRVTYQNPNREQYYEKDNF